MTKNNLLPIFLKLEELNTLVIGAGAIGAEKLSALLLHSPKAKIRLVAKEISEEVNKIIARNKRIEVINSAFEERHLDGIQIVITALNDITLSKEIKVLANQKGILYNAADKPEACDFYLGSVVSKGNLKIGISTNGKSPTMAKRIKEVLNEIIPNEIDESIEQMHIIRGHLKGDFKQKIQKLNQITSGLIAKKERKWHQINLKKILLLTLSTLGIMIAGHLFFTIIPPSSLWSSANQLVGQLDVTFLYFMLGGFIAQMIDGALGMAYGVSATTFLLSFGISPAVASMSVHASEIFTSGVSGLMHLKFGNVHNKLFKAIVLPGVIGAIIGAYLLTEFENYSDYIKPIVSTYTLILGFLII
jgi:siroheme synthase-like protein